jgi:hypothetical protein
MKNIYLFIVFSLLIINAKSQYCGQCSGNTASGYKSTATGVNCVASGEASTATGRNANATGVSSIALGEGTTALDAFTYSIGYYAKARYFRSFAIGSYAEAQASDCFAIGNFVKSNISGAITLGATTSGRELINNLANSLMVGFSDNPTIIVEEKSFKAGFIHNNPIFYVGPKSTTEPDINIM